MKFSLQHSVAFIFSTVLFLHAHAHKAHNHGTANIDVAIDGNQAKFNFEIPAASMYGFEHEAKNEKEKKLVADSKQKFENNINKIVILEDRLKCNFQIIKLDPFSTDDEEDSSDDQKNSKSAEKNKHSAQHGDFKAEVLAKCEKSLSKSKLSFALIKFFPKIENIFVKGLSNEKQFSLHLKNEKGSLEL
ncbi:DUF2796 domain-containing protein [Pigmentibacter sp. JX0631]|uniref:ZrgA family zinc uptake protein n=1 Tax=Pigmentibacter sp. JX0631 TaxID=2976982 RepID=UPI0024699703|nr:DUF2796 domain-containing protein [Pigmentibacter sp. JX0631]WGL60161.1 DUF2796 domain-containing protein [Pigmentibacter sp. JX0631]